MNPPGADASDFGSVPPPGSVVAGAADDVHRAPTAVDADVLGKRIRAAWIDIGVLAVVFIVLAVVFGGAHAGSATTTGAGTTVHDTAVSVSLTGAPLVIFLIAAFVYYVVLESRSGQTIGKRVMHVRVVRVDGGAPDLRAVLLRTAGRFIDFLPAFYFVGWIAVKRREPRQRLGDRLANTTVSAA